MLSRYVEHKDKVHCGFECSPKWGSVLYRGWFWKEKNPAVPEKENPVVPKKEEKPAVPKKEEKPAAEKTPETAAPAGEQGQTQPAAPVCTLSISCASVLDHMDQLDGAKKDLIPADGWLLPAVQVEFQAGESVFDVLKRACRDNKLHMEFSNTPVYHSAYIEGIGNLYEFDCGTLSGWMYRVNGWYPNYGCSRYALADGDVIEWRYTCDLGRDVGCDLMAGE